MPDLVLGLDSSTQSLTAVVLDAATGAVVHQQALNFDAELPAYGTRNGVLRGKDPAVVHAPPLMWAEALDLMFARLRAAIDLGCVRVVAGSAQQHGSVYLGRTWTQTLAGLDPSRPLAAQIANEFTRPTAPVWMDTSTAEDCAALSAALGGDEVVARITGSAPALRFTGPQIRRFARTEPKAWARTGHVALVSSFLASLIAGTPAPIDHGDGSGMHLLDLSTRSWHLAAAGACADGLLSRLGLPATSTTVFGTVSSYWQRRYGLPASALAVVWSGDNPNSAIGLGLSGDGDVALSLGTSDTCFAVAISRPQVPPGGNLFLSPTADWLPLFCIANGSLAREAVRDRHGLDWDGFSDALRRTRPGNAGRLTLPWFAPEILPRVARAGPVRIGHDGSDPAVDVRSVVEGQMASLALRLRTAGIRPRRVRATGGAAANRELLQVAADVLRVPVARSQVANTAALGAAVRAWKAWSDTGREVRGWDSVMVAACAPLIGPAVEPVADPTISTGLIDAYARAEASALAAGSAKA